MRCNHCDYALWNLRDRICPECGNSFLPSEFNFVPNSVRFCCTQCGQDYYGVGDKGHLIPPEFDCVKCGAPQRMDDMVLLPTEGVSETQTRGNSMPWVDGTSAGRPFHAWFATFGRAIGGPRRLMQALPDHASTARAWAFALITCGIYLVIGIGPYFLLFLISAGRVGGGAGMNAVLVLALWIAGTFVGFTLIVTLWGLIAHGILRLTGETHGTIGRTYQAICYSSATTFLIAIPLCNIYVSPIAAIWWTVSATVMLATVQRVHGLRASIAGLCLPGLGVAAIAGLIIWSIVSMSSTMTAAAAAASMPQFSTQRIASAISAYRMDNNTDGPPHAISLVTDNYISSASEFIGPATGTWQATIPDGGSGFQLTQIDSMGQPQRDQTATNAAAALPQGVIAHRAGDFVFTHHGITPGEPDNSLWLVIYWPDPDSNPAVQPFEQVAIGRLDGSVRTIPAGSFAAALSAQNASRRAAGLPALPDPSTVTHASPAGP